MDKIRGHIHVLDIEDAVRRLIWLFDPLPVACLHEETEDACGKLTYAVFKFQ